MEEKKIIYRLKKKDQDALYHFIDKYGSVLKGVIAKILWKYPDLWGEALNDTLLSVWENIEYYDSSKASFKNWCAAIAKYRAIDILRVEIRQEKELLQEAGNVAKVSEKEAVEVDVEEILGLLKEEDAGIFRSIFLEGNSYEETGEKIGMKVETVYSRVSRGRKFLRKWKKGGFENE